MASTTILSDNGASSGSAGLKQTAGNDGVLILQTTTNGGTATNALTIDNSQNVGFSGATLSSWKSNYKAQQIGAATAIVGRTDNNNNYFSSNWYVNSSNLDIYQNNGFATLYSQGTGTHAWYTSSSGTAGGTITFVQAMTLNANNGLQIYNTLGVGNTSPSTSGAGITFPVTQSASTDANTLDDYEEGTFNPTLTCGGGSVTLSGVYDTLSYTKIGRVVTITGQIVVSSVSSPTGTIALGNLPFNMASLTDLAGQARPSIHMYCSGTGVPSTGYFSAFIGFVNGSNSGTIVATYNATYDDTIANWFGNGSDIFVNFSYVAA